LLSFFESLKQFISISLFFGFGNIHAAATTGPAQGPRPTSSTPIIIFFDFISVIKFGSLISLFF
tara:strand:- start:2924 stop:3115 length:192 start_codon:yes stop_codon:yes gene_type:complete